MPEEEKPSRRGRVRATPPPPPDPWRIVLSELKLAAIVALSLTAVVIARRWATFWLGNDTLNADILSGGTFVNDLIGRVETRIFKEDHGPISSGASGPGTRSRTPSDT